MENAMTKPGKNEFKCFQCRLVFAKRQGDWFDWGNIQVHLCLSCARLTKDQPQRSGARVHGRA